MIVSSFSQEDIVYKSCVLLIEKTKDKDTALYVHEHAYGCLRLQCKI